MRQWDPWGYYMAGMGLKFTIVMERHLLRHSSMSGPMAGTAGTHGHLKQSTMEGLICLQLPIHPFTYSLPTAHSTPIHTISGITLVLKNVAKNPAV